jgi:DUF971 family protein
LSRQLLLEWPAETLALPWRTLRANCPSAGERVAREQASANPNPLAVLSAIPSDELQEVRLVGRYALALRWGDGHDAGIFTWETLRSLAAPPAR